MTHPARAIDVGPLRAEEDTSETSYYVTDNLYTWLMAVSDEFNSPGPPANRDVAEEIRNLIAHEARLLDGYQLDEWLELLTRECIYWIPAEGRDPRDNVALEFHDRRRLIDRVARLRTGYAYSQLPRSRTARSVTNIEVWEVPDFEHEIRARAAFVIGEYRAGHHRTIHGWYGYVFERLGGQWRLAVKQINLLDPDQGQGNNSFFL